MFLAEIYKTSKQKDYIADFVCQGTFKQQCEFYNNELAQQAIEFVYIEP